MPEAAQVIQRTDFDALLHAVAEQGFALRGPTIADGAVCYRPISSSADFPVGCIDRQDGGQYLIEKGAGRGLFEYAVGPTSLKSFLFPSAIQLWRGKRNGGAPKFENGRDTAEKLAFIGVRSCELHALAILDNVLLKGPFPDKNYEQRRKSIFIAAVDCGRAGGTCFCASMETGPRVTGGYDLAFTEIVDGSKHYFVTRCGTELGRRIVDAVPHQPATKEQLTRSENILAETSRHMGRTLDTTDIKGLLYRNYEHPRWEDAASRCLSCANCTMVCPTCFCTTVEDVTDLSGQEIERRRKWDSCFTVEHSYIHGGSVRTSTKSRYRQWMVHKLGTWIDQFGSSGCVGCGRCITWCPVGIDITQEARAIRESAKASIMSNEVANHGNT